MLELKRELEWFSFENRIRTLIYENIQPITDKIDRYEKLISGFKIENETNKKLVNDFEFNLSKMNKRVTLLLGIFFNLIFSNLELQNKMNQFENMFMKFENNIKIEFQKINSKYEFVNNKLSMLNTIYLIYSKHSKGYCEPDKSGE